jgi:hypothetical protein
LLPWLEAEYLILSPTHSCRNLAIMLDAEPFQVLQRTGVPGIPDRSVNEASDEWVRSSLSLYNESLLRIILAHVL